MISSDQEKTIASIFSLFGEEAIKIAKSFSAEKRDVLIKMLFPQTGSFLSKRIRCLTADIYKNIGDKPRFVISTLMFVILNRFQPKMDRDHLSVSEMVKRIGAIFHNREGVSTIYNGFPAAAILSHDVDYTSCYDYLFEMTKIEQEHNLRSFINFLPNAKYSISITDLENLTRCGHEIGLHGLNYDLSMPYRSHQKIKKILQKAMESFGNVAIRGFRSHGLLLSRELLKSLGELGFTFDSSRYDRSPEAPLNDFYWPYKDSVTGIWELPLMWPEDSYLFRQRKFKDEEAFTFLVKRIGMVVKLHGVCMINVHPTTMKSHKFFFKRLVSYLSDLEVWNTTPSELVCFLEDSLK